MPSAPALLTPPPTISALQVTAFLSHHRALESSLLVPSPDPLPCLWARCPQKFDYAEEVSAHLHHQLNPGDDHEWCSTCDLGFFDLAALKRHRVIDGRHVACPSCAKEYHSEGGCRTHVKMVHRSESRLVCLGCGEVCWGWEELWKHGRVGVCRGMVEGGGEKADLASLDLRGTVGQSEWPELPGAGSGRGGGVSLGGANGGKADRGKAAGEKVVDEGIVLEDASTSAKPPASVGNGLPIAETATKAITRKKKKGEDDHSRITAGTNTGTESTLNLLAGLSISGTAALSDLGSRPASSVSSDQRRSGHLGDGLASALSSAVNPSVSERSILSSGNSSKLNQFITQARNEAAAKRKQIEEARKKFIALKPAAATTPVLPSLSPTPSASPITPLASPANRRLADNKSARQPPPTSAKPAPALPKLPFPNASESAKPALVAPPKLGERTPVRQEQGESGVGSPQHHQGRPQGARKRQAKANQPGAPVVSAVQGAKTGWLDPVKVRQEQREKIRKNMMGVAGRAAGKVANDDGEADEREGGAKL